MSTDKTWISLDAFEEAFARQEAELESLRQENNRLREALKKAHDAMMTWYSSEYAEHPLGKEIYRILHPPKS